MRLRVGSGPPASSLGPGTLFLVLRSRSVPHQDSAQSPAWGGEVSLVAIITEHPLPMLWGLSGAQSTPGGKPRGFFPHFSTTEVADPGFQEEVPTAPSEGDGQQKGTRNQGCPVLGVAIWARSCWKRGSSRLMTSPARQAASTVRRWAAGSTDFSAAASSRTALSSARR